MATRITVNGKEYGSLDEMPPDVRKNFEKMIGMLADRDGNGVPDILEGKALIGPAHGSGNVTSAVHTSFKINGQAYERFEDIPPELRQVFKDAGMDKPSAMASAGQQLTAPRLMLNSDENSSRLTLLFTPTMLIAFIAAAIVTALIVWKFF